MKRKHQRSLPIPENEVRLDHMDHWPKWVDNRVTCKLPGCRGYTFVKCEKCDTSLCFNKTRNCYKKFHTE